MQGSSDSFRVRSGIKSLATFPGPNLLAVKEGIWCTLISCIGIATSIMATLACRVLLNSSRVRSGISSIALPAFVGHAGLVQGSCGQPYQPAQVTLFTHRVKLGMYATKL